MDPTTRLYAFVSMLCFVPVFANGCEDSGPPAGSPTDPDETGGPADDSRRVSRGVVRPSANECRMD
ncbi:MAG: hypothetical protein AAGJ56_07545 [Myxococcota bacterium]